MIKLLKNIKWTLRRSKSIAGGMPFWWNISENIMVCDMEEMTYNKPEWAVPTVYYRGEGDKMIIATL